MRPRADYKPFEITHDSFQTFLSHGCYDIEILTYILSLVNHCPTAGCSHLHKTNASRFRAINVYSAQILSASVCKYFSLTDDEGTCSDASAYEHRDFNVKDAMIYDIHSKCCSFVTILY